MRSLRNDLPEIPRYQYRARDYPWAKAVLRAAEETHGEPKPTCLCGAPLAWREGQIARCRACKRSAGDITEKEASTCTGSS